MEEKKVGAGRARGGRGVRPPGAPGEPMRAESRPGSAASGSSGDEAGGAVARGRGGLRNTIPKTVKKGPGNSGREVPIMANYFKVITSTTLEVHDYHLTFEPNVEALRARKWLVYQNREAFGDSFIFDGHSNLKMLKEMPGETVLKTVNDRNNVEYTITVKYIAPVPWRSPEMMRLFNTQVRRNFEHLHFALMGRHFFDPQMKQDVPNQQVELWPGFATAIADHDGGLLMVVDNVTKFVRKENVLAILKRFLSDDRAGWQDRARREIPGSIVMTAYNNKTYRIDDIVFDKNPEGYTFDHRGQQKNMVQYYQETYQIEIKDKRQPLLAVKPSARDERAGRTQIIYLVPELCSLTGLTDAMRADFRFMKQVAELSKLDPNNRVRKLQEFINRVNSNPKVKADMVKWDMKFDSNLVKFKGRVLPPEKILCGRGIEKDYVQEKGDFSKEVSRGTEMFSKGPLGRWCVLHTGRDANLASSFAETLNKVSTPMGFALQRPKMFSLGGDRAPEYVNQLRQLASMNVEMAVCILPNNNKDRYDAIKKFCCNEAGIPSQCLLAKTLSKPPMLMSVCTKVAIQMAAKIGLQPWACKIPSRTLMIAGYDTYHDSSQKGRSVGAFVSSLNPDITQWWSRASFHMNSDEMSASLVTHVTEGVRLWMEKNGQPPQRLVIYRDGVSDGMINHVYDFEMTQIKQVLEEKIGKEKIKLAFIIVTKRLNTRFFTKNEQGPGFANPTPGTVIDDVVTSSMRYDFYVISQSVREGTVAPTRYNIIEDETNFRIDIHQQLAFKLTHLYYNWPGTVRVPAPCQYAHKLAYLVGTHLHKEPHTRLCDKLFYL